MPSTSCLFDVNDGDKGRTAFDVRADRVGAESRTTTSAVTRELMCFYRLDYPDYFK